MSSAASASFSSGGRATPGVLFRVSALASAVAVGLVVVSAVLELGTTHWGIALVALPLLVANAVLARLAYSASRRLTVLALASFLVAIALGGVVAWSGEASWAAALHVGAAAVALGVALVVVARVLRGEGAPLARLDARGLLIRHDAIGQRAFAVAELRDGRRHAGPGHRELDALNGREHR